MRHQQTTFLRHAGRSFKHPVDPTCSKRSIPFSCTSLIKPGWPGTAPTPTSGLYSLYAAALKSRWRFLCKLCSFARPWCWRSTLVRHYDTAPSDCSKIKVSCLPCSLIPSSVFHCPCDAAWIPVICLLGLSLLPTLSSCPKFFSNGSPWCEFKSTL